MLHRSAAPTGVGAGSGPAPGFGVLGPVPGPVRLRWALGVPAGGSDSAVLRPSDPTGTCPLEPRRQRLGGRALMAQLLEVKETYITCHLSGVKGRQRRVGTMEQCCTSGKSSP